MVEKYITALDILDDYDHGRIVKPAKGSQATYIITYEECRNLTDGMKSGNDSSAFGVEKDGSFKGSIGAIYQTYGGKDPYPSREGKAATCFFIFSIRTMLYSETMRKE